MKITHITKPGGEPFRFGFWLSTSGSRKGNFHPTVDARCICQQKLELPPTVSMKQSWIYLWCLWTVLPFNVCLPYCWYFGNWLCPAVISCERSDMIFSKGRILSPFVRSCNLSCADYNGSSSLYPVAACHPPSRIAKLGQHVLHQFHLASWLENKNNTLSCKHEDFTNHAFCPSVYGFISIWTKVAMVRWWYCYSRNSVSVFPVFSRKRSDLAMDTQNNLSWKKTVPKQKSLKSMSLSKNPT